MDQRDLFCALISSRETGQVVESLETFVNSNRERIQWSPIGGKENNRGPIEISADPGRSLVERLTNGIDAVLESEYERHHGTPECRSPRQAGITWLGIPERGLFEMTPAERQIIARRVTIKISAGDGREGRVVDIRDLGTGIPPEEMANTILSLNESNKIRKHYLAGTYGQGGSSTFAISAYTFIATRREHDSRVGFTIVRFLDLPPEEFKTGHYVFLKVDAGVPFIELAENDFPAGTLIRHFGYDLASYASPLGPNSVYGLLNQVLFDPIIPVWLDDQVHGYRRVIKGSRNALNGAVDEGDENRRGPTLDHNVPMFYTLLGDFGRVGFEYWVLERPSRDNKKPSAAFVNPARPVVLTLNGQNHAELPVSIVRKEASLPYLTQRLVAHVNCDSLTPEAKRSLFASSREEARRGMVLQLIRDELVRILRSDDELTRLNNAAREQGMHEQDETAIQEMRREVARLLRLQGLAIERIVGNQAGGAQPTTERPAPRPRIRRQPLPIQVQEPPTYIRIVWEEGGEIGLYPGQRRYIRIETDANSSYHNPDNPTSSRTNMIIQGDFSLRGSTPLRGGRFRAILEAAENVAIGARGNFRIELRRPGQITLFDERNLIVEERPPARPGHEQLSLPPFLTRPVSPDEERWAELGWPDDISTIASSAEMENGTLIIYYSTSFPKYASQLARFEQRSPALGISFTRRYEIWLATHSILYNRDQEEIAARRQGERVEEMDDSEAREREERCRMASLASLFASREIELMGSGGEEVSADETH